MANPEDYDPNRGFWKDSNGHWHPFQTQPSQPPPESCFSTADASITGGAPAHGASELRMDASR
ncbi:hypothetical protein OH76DRAFT_1485623 [Lentinus brumalis]|uniref:Uncharacterized protein n=1 Tax=Lentinus brumalis TaxID=2498619 RepID=A0A371D1P1_9APHY|nr:hypothetical protein OH76DRAFT_1485623 [Polyporus brumalis]